MMIFPTLPQPATKNHDVQLGIGKSCLQKSTSKTSKTDAIRVHDKPNMSKFRYKKFVKLALKGLDDQI
jgi:hypothetical protein